MNFLLLIIIVITLQVILGAFLHDIGHILEDADMISNVPTMVTDGMTLGLQGHEIIGANFLSKLGVPEEVRAIGRWHVDAKRYLCWKEAEYYDSKYYLHSFVTMCQID